METYQPYTSLALALAAGLVIGLEREHSRPAPETGRGFPGGIRTYPLVALTGGMAALLVPSLGPWPLATTLLVLGGLLAIGYWRDSGVGHMGFTSEVSALLTFMLGALSTAPTIEPLSRRAFVISAITVSSTVLLSQKTELRAFSDRVSRDDILATLKFLIVAVVVQPLLPDLALGPYGALNPFRIGLMVLFIAGTSFVGYVAMRLWGQGRGMLVTGAIGGLVSSTAVTLASASRAREAPALARTAALAVTVASTLMFLRVLAIALVVERSLGGPLLLPLAAMGGTGLLATAGLYVRDRTHGANGQEVVLRNPFELRSALQFGAFFVAILVASRWASETFGDRGTYLAGVLAGLTDVDAITLSMANLVKAGQLTPAVAARAIVLATASNTLTKGTMALVLCRGPFAWRVLGVSAATLAVGVVAMLLG